MLELTPDELLSTTRAVRKRLDLERPVERDVLEECLQLAQQAPTGSYAQNWHFVVVTDPDLRAGLGDLWRQGGEKYLARVGTPEEIPGMIGRVLGGVFHLRDHLHEVPVHVIPCIEGRTDDKGAFVQASKWGSIMPAAWSFMLAARSRGLGTVWTTFHLVHEREAAELLGIPYDDVMQAALIPVAYTLGTDFKPAVRAPLDSMVHWDRWCLLARPERPHERPAADEILGVPAGAAAQPAVRGDEPVGPTGAGELLGVAGDPVVGALLRRADHLHRPGALHVGRVAVEDEQGMRAGRLGPGVDEVDERFPRDVRPLRAAHVLRVDQRHRFHGVTRSLSTSGRW